MMLIGPELVVFFATSDYYDAIWIIPPVSVCVFLMFLYPMFSNIEFYYEKSSVATSASIVGAILNIILNYIFIPKFGYIAAGYTTLVCYLIFSLMHYLGMKKILKQKKIIEEIYDLKTIIFLTVFMLVMMICVLFIYKYTKMRLFIATILFLLLFVCRKRLISIVKELRG